MMRMVGGASAMLTLVLFLGGATAGDQIKTVKGTIKIVDPNGGQMNLGLLVVLENVKGQKMDHGLSILDTTEFVLIKGKTKKTGKGNKGLLLLVGHEGAPVEVQVKNNLIALKVKATIK